MALEIKLVESPRSWKKIKAKANRSAYLFPKETLTYEEIESRWSADHHIVVGMVNGTKQATDGYVQLNRRFVDRVKHVPILDQQKEPPTGDSN